jgi:hypothetical protein
MKTIYKTVCSGLVLLLLTLTAQAGTQVGAFSVRGLEKYSGAKLSLYYVSGRPAGLGTNGQEIHVNKVLKGPEKYRITGDGVVAIKSVNVPRDGWTSYNYLIFVVHTQPAHALTNPDYRNGRVTRDPVRYYESDVNIEYSKVNNSFEYKTYKTSREVQQGGSIDL